MPEHLGDSAVVRFHFIAEFLTCLPLRFSHGRCSSSTRLGVARPQRIRPIRHVCPVSHLLGSNSLSYLGCLPGSAFGVTVRHSDSSLSAHRRCHRRSTRPKIRSLLLTSVGQLGVLFADRPLPNSARVPSSRRASHLTRFATRAVFRLAMRFRRIRSLLTTR